MDTSKETDPDVIEYLHKWNESYVQFKEGAKGHPFSEMFIEMGERMCEKTRPKI